MVIEETTLEKEKAAVTLRSLIQRVQWENVAIALFLILFWGMVAFIGYRWMVGEVIFPFGCHTSMAGEHCHMYWNLAHVH
ncbi:MAG: hypothetical protein AAF902_03035 [Chloroflexota bacterium]